MTINKVNNLANQQINAQKSDVQGQVRESAAQKAAQQPNAPKADSVSLTPQAQQMTRLQKKAENASGVDHAKVDEIKKAIAEGKYTINAERLAAKIATMEGDLFDR